MKFIIESSAVPIYNRIAASFAQAMMELGHTVHFINASDFDTHDFIHLINDISFDFYVSTNELNFIQKKIPESHLFIFEKINAKIIFIHHDNIFTAFHDTDYIHCKIDALTTIKDRSFHFCLEKSNINLLNSLGITNAYKIEHASEFSPSLDFTTAKWNISFIGHLMSSLSLYPTDSLPIGHHLQALAWNRFCHSSYSIQDKINDITKDQYILNTIQTTSKPNYLAIQQHLIAALNKLSSPMRGQLLSTIKHHRVDIFGGDLSYGRIINPLLILQQENIHYQPATADYQLASSVYQSSRISLNISALQFDSAVNNRVFDVICAGGFVITDNRSDLHEIFPFASEISYETPEEMNEKLSYWINPANNSKYNEIKNEMQIICKEKFNYKNVLEAIFNKISSKEQNDKIT